MLVFHPQETVRPPVPVPVYNDLDTATRHWEGCRENAENLVALGGAKVETEPFTAARMAAVDRPFLA